MRQSKATPNRKLCKREWTKSPENSLRREVNSTRKREHAFTQADNSPHRRLQPRGQNYLRFGIPSQRGEMPPLPQSRRNCAWVVSVGAGSGRAQSRAALAPGSPIRRRESFGLESTLSGRIYPRLLRWPCGASGSLVLDPKDWPWTSARFRDEFGLLQL